MAFKICTIPTVEEINNEAVSLDGVAKDLAHMIHSITASFPDKDDFSSANQVAESVEAEEDNDVGADDMCMDLDPRCDDYKTFCDAANIQVLCPVTCQIGACKTTTTSTTKTTTTHTTTTKSTTTTTSNGTYDEYEGSTGSGDGYYIEGSGIEGSSMGWDGESSGDDQTYIIDEVIVDDTLIAEANVVVDLANSHKQCERDGFQDIHVKATNGAISHVTFFADDTLAKAKSCDFRLQSNADVTIFEVDIVDIRTERDCKYYVDVFSGDTPICKYNRDNNQTS